jgi:hypothetical protein
MSITDELRKWWVRKFPVMDEELHKDFTAIADRIDAEHQKAEDEWRAKNGDMWLKGYAACHEELMEGHPVIAADLEKAGWVKLPVDADGVSFHIGELVDEMLPFGGYATPAPIDTMELSRGASGYVWMVKLDAENNALISPKLIRHHAPTIEDVLAEFAERWHDAKRGERTFDYNALVAEYAKRLTLAGDAS